MERARKLAADIKARRLGLEAEKANLGDHPSYVRAKKYRDEDAARINGMVIGLTFAIGDPLNMQAAEDLIKEVLLCSSS